MTTHYRWETALDQRLRADPDIDNPARRAAARDIRNARDISYHLAQMRKQGGMTQAKIARAMGVSQARVSRMEHGDIEKMQVESVADYVAAIGGHLRLGRRLRPGRHHIHRLHRRAHRLNTRAAGRRLRLSS